MSLFEKNHAKLETRVAMLALRCARFAALASASECPEMRADYVRRYNDVKELRKRFEAKLSTYNKLAKITF